MTIQQPTTEQRSVQHRDLARVVVILAGAIALMLTATVIFGVQQTGPLYDIVPDPAHLSGLPF